MASLIEIQAAIERGWVYYVEQLEIIRLRMAGGCFACTSNDLNCLASSILALQYDVSTENNTSLTSLTYELLIGLLSDFSGSFTPDPTVVTPGITIIIAAGTVNQTEVVFPGDGEISYIFTDLIGKDVLTVYRGTGTVLRAQASAPDNEYAQFDSATGEITVAYPFSDGESLWVEYKTAT